MATISLAIEVRRPCTEAFSFLADLRNDWQWRAEINETILAGCIGPGAVFTEDSYLSPRMPHYTRLLVCTEYEPGNKVTYQTKAGEPFFLQSTRSVRATAGGKAEVQYTLAFDTYIVRHGLGFWLPAFAVAWAARRAMKNYLKRLKQVLEERGCVN